MWENQQSTCYVRFVHGYRFGSTKYCNTKWYDSSSHHKPTS